jgi:hypothetical protein
VSLIAAVTVLALAPYAEEVKPDAVWKAGSSAVQIALSADASTVATLDPVTGTIATWDARSGAPIETLGKDKGGRHPEVSADGKLVATRSKDGKLRVWSHSASPKALATLDLPVQEPEYRFASSGHRLAFTTRSGLGIYDPDAGKTVASARFRFPERFILQPRANAAGIVVADTSVRDSGFYLWDGIAGHKVVSAPLGRQVTDFVAPATERTLIYQGIAFDPKAGLSALLYEYDLKTRKSAKLLSLATGRSLITFRYFDPKGCQIGVQHYPGQPTAVRVKTPAGGVRTFITAAKGKRLDLSVDAAGKAIATVGDDATVRVWRLVP